MADTDDNGIPCITCVSPKDGANLEVISKKDTKVAEEDIDDEVLDCHNDMASILASGMPANASSSKGGNGSTTPIVEKIRKIENLIIEGKVTLVDDDGQPLRKVDSSTKVGNPFSKVGNMVVSDSDDDDVFDDHIGTLHYGSGGKEQSIYEQ